MIDAADTRAFALESLITPVDTKEGFQSGTLPLKNGNFYKRSWTAGCPYSSTPVWGDLDHVPEAKRWLLTRPDLGLAAMQHVLSQVSKEQLVR